MSQLGKTLTHLGTIQCHYTDKQMNILKCIQTKILKVKPDNDPIITYNHTDLW